MQKTSLTESNRSTLVNALSVAAERFDDNARVCLEQQQPRLAEQFERQARETRELAVTVEDADEIFIAS